MDGGGQKSVVAASRRSRWTNGYEVPGSWTTNEDSLLQRRRGQAPEGCLTLVNSQPKTSLDDSCACDPRSQVLGLQGLVLNVRTRVSEQLDKR